MFLDDSECGTKDEDAGLDSRVVGCMASGLGSRYLTPAPYSLIESVSEWSELRILMKRCWGRKQRRGEDKKDLIRKPRGVD
jgi:hypothetical protein